MRWKHEQRVRKVRCVDDFTDSPIRAATATGESIHRDTLDVLVALLHLVGERGQRVRFRKDDSKGACKTLPLRTEDLWLAVAAWRGASSTLRAMPLWSCPFGAVSSLHLGAAAQCVSANLFLVVYARYVDDHSGLKSCRTYHRLLPTRVCWPHGHSTAWLARCVIEELLVWELDKETQVTAAQVVTVASVQIEFVDESRIMPFRETAERASKWTNEIHGYFQAARLSPSQAKKLESKLSWGASNERDRGARVHRYFVPCVGGCDYWNAISERRTPAPPEPTVRLTLCTVATGPGTVAGAAVCQDQRLFARSTVPTVARRWRHHRKQQVATWELFGAAWLHRRFFVALPRQSGRNELIGGIWFHEVHVALLLAWRVPSKLQVEDGHCRQPGGCTPFLSVRSGGEAPAVCRDTLRSARG